MKLAVAVFFLLAGFALANGNKSPDLVINFFLQADNPDPGKKLTFPWRTSVGLLHFKKASEFKTDEVIAHRPFPSPHADTEYGMVFQLDRRSSDRLKVLTGNSSNHGKYLIVFLNQKPLDMVRIDKQVDDGLICVWRGLVASDVHKADALVPRIGENKKKWKERRKKEIKQNR
jgi:hypothetical protein